MRALAVILMTACTVKGSSETGPTVHISLATFLDTVTDQSSNRVLGLESGETSYVIDVSITSSQGQEIQDGDSLPNYHDLASFNASITVPGVTVPALNWQDDGYGDGGYQLQPALQLPTSAKGKMMAVHLDGVSDDGLASNVIDLTISLQ
ncbi:MAG: hypothetical protein QM831_05750 [Kofleriaceae bacterium]